MIGRSNPIYSRRKRFLPEYRELFAALLNIPDKDVRERVTDAINGVQYQLCSDCKKSMVYTNVVHVGTQTENILEAAFNEATNEMEPIEMSEDNSSKQATFEKRRRKRKRNCPKVVKTAQHSSTTPVLIQDVPLPKADIPSYPAKLMSASCDEKAVSYFFETCDTNVLNIDLNIPLENAKTENIKKVMKDDWDISTKYNAGLLPIHDAIVQNELHKLKRQIYVWKFRNFNLLDLYTQDGNNVLQLALKENCIKSIIDELLKEVSDLNDIDDDHNTIIHLAVANLHYNDMQQQQQLLESFLKRIDLNMLSICNDDGLTPLHIAVKMNEYLTVENILNVVDKRLRLKSVPPPTELYADKKKFLDHYCRQCDSFDGRESNELKNKILNAKDMKSGCTALFFAMELCYEHIVYLLITHMCNPTIKNLSGIDANSYYSDYGKNANITGALERLTIALQK